MEILNKTINKTTDKTTNNIKYNYHTHIYLCRHAVGDFEDYVLEAIKQNYTDLGFSDHGPLYPAKAKEMVGYSRRMSIDEFHDVYLKNYYIIKAKYQDKINLHLGLEVEYLPVMKDFFKELIETKTVEYLILGQHYYQINDIVKSPYDHDFNEEQVRIWTETVIEGLETGYFKILAHPDVFLWRAEWKPKYEKYCRQMIECCIKNNIYIEINANGVRNSIHSNHITIEDGKTIYAYPNLHFINILKQYPKALVILGDDCHNPLHLNDDNTKIAYDLAINNNIKIIKDPII